MPVYLDCAATSPMDPRVLEVCVRYLRDEYANAASRTHQAGADWPDFSDYDSRGRVLYPDSVKV